MQRRYIALGAIALLIGALAPMAVNASEYDRIGAVATGVYFVEADDDRFRIEAEEATEALVYDLDGELVVARSIGAGDSHDFILDGGSAIVALFAGEAVVSATGDGDVTELDTDERRIKLVEEDGDAVDTTVTIDLPERLVGVSGAIDGAAENLLIVGSSDSGTVFRASDSGVEAAAAEEAAEALADGVLDVSIQADALDGAVYVTLLTPILPEDIDEADEEIEAEEPELKAMNITEADYVPLRFHAPNGAVVTFDIHEGYMLDASLFASNGTQVEYLHLGAPLEDSRNYCHSLEDCTPWDYRYHNHVEPQEIALELEPDTYILFVRAGHVDGALTIADADGENLLDDAEVLELDALEVHEDSEIELETPLLDLWHDSYDVDAFESLHVGFGNDTAYEYNALVNAFGVRAGSDEHYDPSVLSSGLVTIDFDGMTENAFHQEGLHLVTIVE